ncbi:hypothetical protein J6590_067568 [Homalodisca vitripennis]|nr:hypothetical protein J6590_067568 [Homalodisca vitripennis]
MEGQRFTIVTYIRPSVYELECLVGSNVLSSCELAVIVTSQLVLPFRIVTCCNLQEGYKVEDVTEQCQVLVEMVHSGNIVTCCNLQESYKVEDVTEQCQALVETVQQICTQRQYNNFTINHLADIWKGSKCRKVLDNGHDTLRSFGQLTGWDKVDVCRLINKLVMEDYLAEYLVTSNDNTHSYIRMGPRARELLHGGSRVVFSMREVKAKKSAVNSPAAKNGEESRCPELDAIYERCFSELMDVVTAIAEINEVNTNTIMNIQALKGMSLTLPESREEMLTITGVTQANYEKYGRDLLKITCRYAEEKSKLNFTDITKKKRSLSPSSRSNGGAKKKRKSGNAKETPAGSYVAPYVAKFRNNGRKKYKSSRGRGGGKGRGGRGGGSGYRATASSNSHQTMQSSRPLPPSNRPGFMPAPKVTLLRR